MAGPRAMLVAAVPKAAIAKDGYFWSNEGDINARTLTLEVYAVSVTCGKECLADLQLM
jgi:hypothetical protein